MTSPATIDPTLSALARRAGLVHVWQDVHGQMHQVSDDVLRYLLDTLNLPCRSLSQIKESLEQIELESLYGNGRMIFADVGEPVVFHHQGSLHYTLMLENGEQYGGVARQIAFNMVRVAPVALAGYHILAIGNTRFTLAATPRRCPSVSDLTGNAAARLWGVAAQLYSLRRAEKQESSSPASTGEDGAGDYTALAIMARQAAGRGAGALAISPVHAMFSADPQRYSPYAPSSRIFLNTLYINPVQVLGGDAVDAARARLGLNVGIIDGDPALIDWPHTSVARRRLMRQLFEQFESHAPELLGRAFNAFRRKGGDGLERHGRYEALHAHYSTVLGASSGWQDWPDELHDPAGPGVQAYATQHKKEIRFHVFLQWLADEGLKFAQQSALDAGMPVGLITDLAIGVDARGSQVWSRQDDILDGISAGAAPDLYQSGGQNWGLTVFSPRALRRTAYAPFIETLRAALAHAGAVRIDHVLGLARMWLVPQGAAAADGVYLRYPMEDMLKLVVLEASRRNALVIGENLGTVPPGFNERLYEKGIFGTSVLWFERTSSIELVPDFKAPDQWEPRAIATSATHDLPTIAGWWQGRDLQWRKQLGQIAGDELIEQMEVRNRDKKALWRALKVAGCVAANLPDPPEQAPREAILSFIAGASSPLVMIPMEDLLGVAEQPNLPGSEDAAGRSLHPNWRRRFPITAEDLFRDPGVQGCIAAIARARIAS